MIRLALLLVLVLAGVLLYRTFTLAGEQPPGSATAGAAAGGGAIRLDEAAVLEHLRRAITFATVSPQPPAARDAEAFDAFLDWLESTYPRVFAELSVTRVNRHSLLLAWTGGDPAAQPVLLAGHYDVVPVIAGSESEWQHPPFAGTLADGYVWGRGALDNKNGVIGLLEAVAWCLEQGVRPRRTVYLSFGHDEEIGGEAGAAAVVEKLAADGVSLAWSLDEGSFVFENMMPGVQAPVATINVAEKGSLTLQVVARGEGGHSSMPPAETAVGRLARALVLLEDHPVPGGLEGVAAESFDAVAPHMAFLPRLMFANRWLFGPLVEARLAGLPFANAMMRTTTAPTMLAGSPKINVLPVEAVATVNFRIHPRDSVDDVVGYVRELVGGEHVEVRVVDGNPASAVASAEADGFRRIAAAVRAEFPGAVVAPGLLVAATDSRHYGRIAADAYRFNPMLVSDREVSGFHGTNERIRAEGMLRGVRTYVRQLRRL